MACGGEFGDAFLGSNKIALTKQRGCELDREHNPWA
jgi:hypothetical protein